MDRLLFHEDYDSRAPDRVSWIYFLAFLRLDIDRGALSESVMTRQWDQIGGGGGSGGGNEVRSPGPRSATSWPYIRFIQHSWDFVPPDVVKPLASSTVGDIAVLVRMTGMVWKTFEPHKGIMIAEGGPHTISSMDQKGLGIVLQYRCLDRSLTKMITGRRTTGSNSAASQEPRHWWSPLIVRKGKLFDTEDASTSGLDAKSTQNENGKPVVDKGVTEDTENLDDDLGHPHGLWPATCTRRLVSENKRLFGYIPADPALNMRDIRQRTQADVRDELKQLCQGVNDLDRHLKDHLWQDRYEFNDLTLMLPEPSRQRGMPRATNWAVHYNAHVLLWTRKQFAQMVQRYLAGESFLEVLESSSSGAPQTKRDGERTTLPGRTSPLTDGMEFVQATWQLMVEGSAQGNEIEWLDEMQTRHMHTTEYFVDIENRLPFHCLLRMHMSSAIWAAKQARDDVVDHHHPGIFPRSEGHLWRNRNIELYFCYLPRYIEFIARHKDECPSADDDLIIEAWLMLMTRAGLFFELHGAGSMPGGYLPTEYYGSRLPVWLA